MTDARKNLIEILQNAHAGEMAAAYAYRGHWKSLRESAEKEQIKKIEAEEWAHRANVRRWLDELGAEPRALREATFRTLGRLLGAACYVSGWFFPMYFAGRLESQNVREYIDAAEFAKKLKMDDCAAQMMEMSRTELEHEVFFRQTIAGHRLLPAARKFFRWG
jgi:demethoxyubiquinone hydroxylase (CLK1/Coq7/Cat5 family)